MKQRRNASPSPSNGLRVGLTFEHDGAAARIQIRTLHQPLPGPTAATLELRSGPWDEHRTATPQNRRLATEGAAMGYPGSPVFAADQHFCGGVARRARWLGVAPALTEG